MALEGSQGQYMATEGYKRAYIDMLNNSKQRNTEQIGYDLSQAGESFRQQFNRLVGRNPTNDEASKFFSDVLRGKDVVYASSPQDLSPLLRSYLQDNYSDIAAQEKDANLGKKAGEYQGSVNELFRSTLNRDATPAELDHFSKLKASGEADDYDLGEALKTLPEYMERQDQSARDSLRSELQTADQRFLTEKALPAIQSKFAQQGRYVGPESTALSSAIANVGQDLNADREQYLATVGREDYVNRRQQAIQSYLDQLKRTYQKQDYATARTDALGDAARTRGYDILDYDKEKRAYDEYIKNMGRRKSGGGLGGLLSSGAGAAIGAVAGGVPGAQVGYSIGNSLFSSY